MHFHWEYYVCSSKLLDSIQLLEITGELFFSITLYTCTHYCIQIFCAFGESAHAKITDYLLTAKSALR